MKVERIPGDVQITVPLYIAQIMTLVLGKTCTGDLPEKETQEFYDFWKMLDTQAGRGPYKARAGAVMDVSKK